MPQEGAIVAAARQHGAGVRGADGHGVDGLAGMAGEGLGFLETGDQNVCVGLCYVIWIMLGGRM